MKNTFFLSFIALLIISSCTRSANKFTINGTIAAQDTGWAILHKIDAESKLVAVDSLHFKHGKFTFRGNIESPEFYILSFRNMPGTLPFFLESGELTIDVNKDSLDKSKVTGSKSNDEYTAYNLSLKPYQKAMEKAYVNYAGASGKYDTVAMKAHERAYDSVNSKMEKASMDYILKNKNSVVAAFIASSMIYALPLGRLDTIVKNFSGDLAKNRYVIALKDQAAVLANVQVGKNAPEIVLNDTLGKPVKLSSLKGKYVLIDFWASWCGPCRAENPAVVKAYHAYADKGFTILGVSLDKDKKKWEQAIRKDGLAWNHVSDLKGWSSAGARIYGVMSIPANFLLDKEGRIMAANLRGEDLEKKLESIFNPPVTEEVKAN